MINQLNTRMEDFSSYQISIKYIQSNLPAGIFEAFDWPLSQTRHWQSPTIPQRIWQELYDQSRK
jgi:hypothetical protein